MAITGRASESKALVAYCRQTLRLTSPEAITALTRAVAIILDELPNERRALGVAGIIAVLAERGGFEA
jgi:hypothetical protein